MDDVERSTSIADRGAVLIGAAIGSGIAAVTAERGGADFLLAVNAGRMRNRGAASIASMLPCHDPAALTEDFLAKEVLPSVRIPVLLGVNCWGATCSSEAIVERVRALGAAGAVNFPNATLMSPGMRALLGKAGRGAKREVQVLRAVQDAGLLSIYYCGTREHARMAAEAGLDMILLNFGWNVGGIAGHERRVSLEEVCLVAHEHARIIRRIKPRARILLEGGPIITAEDLGHVARVASIDGYVGGSTLDRLPYEESVMNRIAGYRHATSGSAELGEGQNELLGWGRRQGFVGRSQALLQYLATLRSFADSTHPLGMFHDPGADLGPSLRALAGKGGPGAVVDLDPASAIYPGHVAQQLFGREAGESGLLADPRARLLVLHGVEKFPPSVQRRIARSLKNGSMASRDARRRLPILARCVFVFEGLERQAAFPPELTAELAHLLTGWSVALPPLRDRVEDLPDLFARTCERSGISREAIPRLSPAALQDFRRHPWRRNENELEEIVGRVLGLGLAGPLSHEEAAHLLRVAGQADAPARPGEMERSSIVEALWRNGFHKGRTAAALHISRKTLYNKMRKFGLRD